MAHAVAIGRVIAAHDHTRNLKPFSHAFQPIVDASTGNVFAYEALIRGAGGEGAHTVLSGLDAESAELIDRRSRTQAIALAATLGMKGCLSVNALPRSFEGDDCGEHLLAASESSGFPLSRVIVEVTENEAIADIGNFVNSIAVYRRLGIQIALDDFGAGFSGLNLLADFQPDLLKLDMNLVRDISRRGPRQAIVRAILQVCEDLAIDVIGEGVETNDEYLWFGDHGVQLFQGYLFSRPAFEALPTPHFPA